MLFTYPSSFIASSISVFVYVSFPYDIGTLLHNNESYLEGTIDSKYDVDYYSFSYPQKSFYSKMGISSDVYKRQDKEV